MASLDDYMIQTPADEWSLLGFLIFRKRQDDFSGIKDKEHYRFQMSLLAVQSCDIFTTVEKAKATCCLNNFKKEINEENVCRFWRITIREKQESKLITLEGEIKISQKKKNLLVERVALQHTELLYATAQEAGKQSQIAQQKITNELKRPAEEASPVITTPPNLRVRSPPPFYNNEDNSFGDYNEESNEVEDASTEASPDEIDILTSSEFENINKPIDNPDKEGVESDDLEFTDSSISNESKKSKMILSWKHVTEKIIIDRSSDHDWIMNGYNISEDFREFQTQTVEQLKNNPSFSYATDVDKILCLSSIMYVKEDKPEYVKCSDQIWKSVMPSLLTPETLPVVVKLMILEYSEILMNKDLLLKTWHQNWAKWDPAMTEEEKKIFDCVQLVMRNFFLTLTSNGIDHKMDEDTFAHRYFHLLLEEIFNTNDYKFVWANGESSSSKNRRKADNHMHGRKPDFRVLFSKEDKKYEITYGEIKPPSTPNNVVNKALIKLAEFMKGSLDDIGNKPGFETFSILVNGSHVKLFSMDLNFDGVYRLNQIGKMIMPTEHANFLTIIPVISNFYSLLRRVDRAIGILNAPSTPTNQSYHRLSNSSPQKVISVLKLPPPVVS
ncbi:16117_t:CDS:10 [Funneliformis mosseae]|uniref:16117_t:CDS:1 n=1 Tax=Funneliformis mosseae TaxID=27381 RepID=A0A9N9H7E3_FUNMO|nr:16117_t:CDS:10 [Funneliformis mosseae]